MFALGVEHNKNSFPCFHVKDNVEQKVKEIEIITFLHAVLKINFYISENFSKKKEKYNEQNCPISKYKN